MKENLTEIVAVLDRSGSMQGPPGNEREVINGFNTFVKEQREIEGDANLTLVLFDDRYEMIYSRKNLKEVPELTSDVYYARGLTKLAESIGKTINYIGQELDKTPEHEKPSKVIFIIFTDGHENASIEFTTEKVKEMVKHQREKYSWQFIFFGADIDAYATGGGLGFSHGSTVNYGKGEATKFAIQGLSSKVGAYRSGTVCSTDFSNEEKEEIEKWASNKS